MAARVRVPSFARWFPMVALGAGCVAAVAAAPPPVRGRGVVAADHRLASEAGAELLAKGGNAVDAAVAAALAAGVVQPSASGLGGGGFAVVSGGGRAPVDSVVLDFRETAPTSASRDMYRGADGQISGDRSVVGGLSVAIPGESRGLWALHERLGRLSAAEVAAPAIRLAAEGFVVEDFLATWAGRTNKPEIQSLFTVGGRRVREGDLLQRLPLAKTLKRWVTTRGEVLHTGDGAAAIVAETTASGGILTLADLASYAPVDRKPIIGTYRGYTVVTMPPPSSGGVALTEMLGVLEGYDVGSLGHGSADHLHLLAEAMKHAYADRAHHLGDPGFVEVPVERLLSPARRDEIRRAIWPGRTFPAEHYGPLIVPPKDAGTEHISVLDADGLAVSLTTTVNTAFGSGLVVDSLGVILNDQMDDFAIAPGVPNAYGLIGSEANAVAPGKRPLSSMTPTVLLDRQGVPVLVVGGSGGAQIISSVLQVVSNVVDFGMDPQDAVAAPRIHHQWQPDTLVVEPETPRDVVLALQARGHTVKVDDLYSAVQALSVKDGVREGASDPRKGGVPAGTW